MTRNKDKSTSRAAEGISTRSVVLARSATRSGRPPVSKGEIVLAIRERITSGELSPGARLPTHRELRRELNANIVTVGRAIDQLRLDGFVDTQGARGTFVATHPPHLFRYALVFASHPSESNWSRHWEALAKEAATLHRDGPVEIPVYHDVDVERRGTSGDFERLTEDVLAHRLAGLIFASHPWTVAKTPILDEPGIPRVAMMDPDADYPRVANVVVGNGLIERALDYLAAKGRKRLGVLTLPLRMAERTELIRRQAAARGLETRPYWFQSAASGTPISAQASVHLMMRDGQVDRPDALLVTDDNLVEYATAGLVDAGVRVPTDVDVVVHCNFPWPTPSVVPVRRIGYDAAQSLRACLNSIDVQRQGSPVPAPVMIPPLFEDELPLPETRASSQVRTEEHQRNGRRIVRRAANSAGMSERINTGAATVGAGSIFQE